MKKIAKCVLLSLLVAFVLCPMAYAVNIYKAVDNANDRIDRAIQTAINQADRSNQDTDKIIERLYDKTERIIDKLDDKAADEGVTIEYEYIPVVIDGQTIYIDPARVIGI